MVRMAHSKSELEELGLKEGVGDLVQETIEGPGVWLHVPARGSMRVALLRDRPMSYHAHWAGGRMQVCWGSSDCTLCKMGIGSKKRYVYTVLDTTQGIAGLLEVAPSTCLMIDRDCCDKGFARGLVFELRKEGGVANGRIVAKCFHTILKDFELPEGPDVVAVFRKMRDEVPANPLPWGRSRAGAQL